MSIIYTYEIISVDADARCMEVVYSAEGHKTMHIGARLPYEGESLDAVIRNFAPVNYWLEQQIPVVTPVIGTTGVLAPVPDEVAPVEDPSFMAIFPTPATGAIGTTVFE